VKVIIKPLIFLVVILLIFFGGLFSTNVINKNFSIDKVKLIYDMPSIRDSVSQHQKDARYLPYRLRLIVFNNLIYVYQALRNIANFWNLNNINKTILLANLYPIFIGLKLIGKEKYLFWMCILGFCFCSIVIGLNKMVDARSATLFMVPIFGYLILKGIRKVNMKFYLPLLIISILLIL